MGEGARVILHSPRCFGEDILKNLLTEGIEALMEVAALYYGILSPAVLNEKPVRGTVHIWPATNSAIRSGPISDHVIDNLHRNARGSE